MVIDLSTATTEDFLRALDENPEFRQAVRRRVLSRELLELPELLASLTARVHELTENTNAFIAEQRTINKRVDTFITEQRTINERVDTFITEQRAINERVDTFIAEQRTINEHVDTFIAEQRQFNQEQRQFNQEQRQFNREQRQFNQEQRHTNRRLEDAIGELKGERVERVVKRHFADIPYAMGYQCSEIVSREDRMKMVRDHDARDLSEGERHSFYNADLVVKAEDENGATHYIAVEASYTADRRDTDRALRNAELLHRFTGRPAHAAVASLRNDRNIDSLISEETVYWYRMTEKHLTAE